MLLTFDNRLALLVDVLAGAHSDWSQDVPKLRDEVLRLVLEEGDVRVDFVLNFVGEFHAQAVGQFVQELHSVVCIPTFLVILQVTFGGQI